MPNRKKFNARFPPARIKKIMRTDKEVGKVAAPVPVVISRALELFAEQLLRQTGDVTVTRGSRTLSPAHLKQCIFAERRFDFLKELVECVPDASAETEDSSGATSSLSRLSAPAPVQRSKSTETSASSVVQPPASSAAAAATTQITDRSGPAEKYLKVEVPSPLASTSNGAPYSAPLPRDRPPPGLIHTSMLGLSGASLSAAVHSGTALPFTFPHPSSSNHHLFPPFYQPPLEPPAPAEPLQLAVRYNSADTLATYHRHPPPSGDKNGHGV